MSRVKVPKVILGIFILSCSSVVVYAMEKLYRFEVPKQEVSAALNAFAQQAEQQVLFPFNRVRGITSNKLKGDHTVVEGIAILLRGTELKPVFSNDGIITIISDANNQNAFEGTTPMKKDKRLSILSKIALLIFGVTSVQGVSAQQSSGTQDAGKLEEVIVTAQKRKENLQDVPISISVLSGQKLNSKFSSGDTTLTLASTVPGLYAESTNGRHAPRFYIRGLGNASFSLTATQPVSYVYGDVAMELASFKNFPVFDLDAIEVIRGPQSTLFGRNATAGVIKFDLARPTEETNGFVKFSAGNLGVLNTEGAIGGTLIDGILTGRVSFITQHRDDWVDNVFTGEDKALGGHDEKAARIQLLWTPTDNFSARFMHQRRDLTGHSASLFRAGTISTGFNDLNSNYTRDEVAYDHSGNNIVEAGGTGTTLKLTWDVGDYTFTSVTGYYNNDLFNRADVDGGVVDSTSSVTVPPGLTSFNSPFAVNLVDGIFGPALTFPGEIFLNIDTAGVSEAIQRTQEFSIASNFDGPLNFQAGGLYFSDTIQSQSAAALSDAEKDVAFDTDTRRQNNDAWAVFAQVDYDINDQLSVTAGLRYSEDEKDSEPQLSNTAFTELSDENVSWNLSMAYELDENSQVYARVATGFRAPSMSTAGSAAFGGMLTTATSETVLSFEVGYKAELLDGRLRFDAAAYYYEVDDLQLTAFGGNTNTQTILNAKGGTGYGLESSIEYLITDNLLLTGGFAYTDTEIKDDNLFVAQCFACTILDPIVSNLVQIDGNPFPHSPDWTLNVELDYTYPLSNNNEFFLYTDWKARGETNEFLYESVEFINDPQFEGGVRGGYRDNTRGFEVAMFVRNVTDEDNILGALDFATNAALVNEPRTWGIEASYRF